jgi:hypothetical protein
MPFEIFPLSAASEDHQEAVRKAGLSPKKIAERIRFAKCGG